MEEQTGFSSSARPGSTGASCEDEPGNGDSTPPSASNRNHAYYNHSSNELISIKSEPEEEVLSEESWRAYYPHSGLVVVNGASDDGLYETYKLPSLAKFGKGLVGKLPAIWSVAVASPEGELITPHQDGASPEQSPVGGDIPGATPPTVYVQANGKAREDSVIQPVPEGGIKQEKDSPPSLLAPTAVEVKDDIRDDQRELQTESPELPLEGVPYGGGEFAAYEPLGGGQYSVLTNVVVTVAPPHYAAPSYALANAADYYREQPAEQQYAAAIRQQLSQTYPEAGVAYVSADRLFRQQGGAYKQPAPHGLTVDLPSPDSGIGGEATVTPRDSLHQMFDYNEMTSAQQMLQPADEDSSQSRGTPVSSPASRKNSWNDYGRNAELDKVQIPKLFSEVGFHYFLESPISTSQRREDDRMTYINKGQYYGITLEYINDPDRTLRSCTVKSTVMLVFREEKSHEDELKAWKFWHSRQHSVKQRILDADTKNSCGIIGQIEEITHNAIAFYWNPLEGPAKISVSVHCLSTDFSNQKGVKGFPLHIQVDTTDDLREGAPPIHRGYCQIKVFCDKGAERKTRDEERRAAKRKLTATGSSRKKIEEMYHLPIERSEFYSMSDLSKPPILFTPEDDADKGNGPELTFYSIAAAAAAEESGQVIPDTKPAIDIPVTPPLKRIKLVPNDRLMLYVRRPGEEVFFPLHLMPPSLTGLAKAIESKYNINVDQIRHLYKRCKKGTTVVMDDDMIRLYCNEDTFVMEVLETEDQKFDITLVEL